MATKSKTQAAFLRYRRATSDADRWKALEDLTHLAIAKCRGLWPPIETDIDGQIRSRKHAFNRRKTSRYTWIQNWLHTELDKNLPNETGHGLIARCRWRLTDLIRKHGRRRERQSQLAEDQRRMPRISRKQLPAKEKWLDLFDAMVLPEDKVLRDLWERLIDTYPEWKLMTDRHLAAIYGVHENVMRSRRHALRVHDDRIADAVERTTAAEPAHERLVQLGWISPAGESLDWRHHATGDRHFPPVRFRCERKPR